MSRLLKRSWSTTQLIIIVLCYTVILSTGMFFNSSISLDRLKPGSMAALRSIAATTKGARNTDVVVYVYSENQYSSRNLEFFVAHALHDKIDFIFVINGYNVSVEIPVRSNIQVIRKENECLDLGSYRQILEQDGNLLLNRYRRFILMNASIRGPFFPAWARTLRRACWTDLFLSHLTERNKLVGLSVNCGTEWAHKHVQSMLVAVDRTGYDLIRPSLECWGNLHDAITKGEIEMTDRVISAGYDADVVFAAKYQRTFPGGAREYFETCGGPGDGNKGNWEPNAYWGMDVNPFDTVFVKSIRTRWPQQDKSHVYAPPGQKIFETFTEWVDNSNFSSYDQC